MDAGVREYRASVLDATMSDLHDACKRDVIKDAFETTGICPWCRDRVLGKENIQDDHVPETQVKSALQNMSGS